MNAPVPVIIYTPSSALAQPGKVFLEVLDGLWQGRELAWRLFRRDVAALYRQSVLGYLWAFLPPLATTATFVFLSSQNILQVGATPVHYTAYVLIGTVLWQSFSDALHSPLRAVSQNRSMLVKITFPREALVVAGMLDVAFNFCIRLVLLVPVFWLFEVPLSASALLFPLGAAALMLLGIALGVMLTPIAVLYSDVGRGLTIVTTFWLFLTPVIYPPPQSGMAQYLTTVNPVSPVILTARDWLIGQPSEHLTAFFVVTGAAAGLLLLALILYHVALPHLIERMGG